MSKKLFALTNGETPGASTTTTLFYIVSFTNYLRWRHRKNTMTVNIRLLTGSRWLVAHVHDELRRVLRERLRGQ